MAVLRDTKTEWNELIDYAYYAKKVKEARKRKQERFERCICLGQCNLRGEKLEGK